MWSSKFVVTKNCSLLLQSLCRMALVEATSGTWLMWPPTAGCWLTHALATKTTKLAVLAAQFPLLTSKLCAPWRCCHNHSNLQAAAALLEDRMWWKETLISSSSQLRLMASKKQSCSAEKVCVQALLSPFPCTSFSLQMLLYIRTRCWKVDPAWWLMLIKQPSQGLVRGRTWYNTPDHGPSADLSWASWKGDAIFPSAGPNITEVLVTHQEGKRVVYEEICSHHHLGHHCRGLRPHHLIQPWAQQLSACYHSSPVQTPLPCKEALLGIKDACRWWCEMWIRKVVYAEK